MIRLAPLALASCLAAAGCAELSTTSPTGSATVMDALAGAWTLGSSSALPAGCTRLDYAITKSSDGRSSEVQFSGACGGVEATGTGRGTLAGSTLSWTAEGTASRDGLSCPFKVNQGTAAPEANGVRVTFTGTVCGLPISGSELLQRK